MTKCHSSSPSDLHKFFNVHTHLTNVEEGFFEVYGRRFYAAAFYQQLKIRFPVEAANLDVAFKVTTDLQDFWRMFNYNARFGKYQLLCDFCEANAE